MIQVQLKNLKKNRQSAILAVYNKTRGTRVTNGQRNIGLVYYAMAHSIGQLAHSICQLAHSIGQLATPLTGYLQCDQAKRVRTRATPLP